MTVFVDTSALYAAIDRDDDAHAAVAPALDGMLDRDWLVTSSYVVAETAALVQGRLGMPAARDLLEQLVPALDVVWVDEDLHGASVVSHLAAGRRDISLVDHVSFEVMRRHAIRTALAVDRHFAAAGFDVVPAVRAA